MFFSKADTNILFFATIHIPPYVTKPSRKISRLKNPYLGEEKFFHELDSKAPAPEAKYLW